MARDGVLLVAHGTPETLAEIPEFLLKIRRGRPPSEELVRETRRRYELIGASPLLRITQAQAQRLAEVLALPVAAAMRLWHPYVEDVLPSLIAQGVERVCVLPLAPFSVDLYHRAVVNAAQAADLDKRVDLLAVGPWGTEPALVAAHAQAIRRAGPADAVIATAHSLPMTALKSGDRYAIEVEASVQAVEKVLGQRLTLAYQSQNEETEWLGPDLRTVLGEVRAAGARRVVVTPIGFPADHIETLYDLDIEAAGWALDLGIDWVRIPAQNDSTGLVAALASVAQRALGA